MVLAWVIDDGFKSRNHRKNIFNANHREVSIIAGEHSTAEFCVVAIFASQVVSKTKGAEIEMKNQELRAKEYRKEIMQGKNWTEFAQEVFHMQNKARVNPKFFIGHLERCLGRFRG